MIVSSSQKVSQPPLLEKRTVDKDGELALYIVNGCPLSCIYYFTTRTHTHTHSMCDMILSECFYGHVHFNSQ